MCWPLWLNRTSDIDEIISEKNDRAPGSSGSSNTASYKIWTTHKVTPYYTTSTNWLGVGEGQSWGRSCSIFPSIHWGLCSCPKYNYHLILPFLLIIITARIILYIHWQLNSMVCHAKKVTLCRCYNIILFWQYSLNFSQEKSWDNIKERGLFPVNIASSKHEGPKELGEFETVRAWLHEPGWPG